MGKRSTILAVTALAVLLAGIALAVMHLYRSSAEGQGSQAAPAGWSVLKAVPSDAAAVLVLDGSAKAARVAADSTGLVQGLIAPGNAPFMTFLSAAARYPVAVSLHNSGSMVPLVAVQAPAPDSTLLDLAAAAGLKTQLKEGFLLASRSETFLGASSRHLQEGVSILGTRHLQDLLRGVSGHAVLLVSHAQAPKLLQVNAGSAWRHHATLVKDLTTWSAWTVQDWSEDHLVLKGSALPGEAPGSFFAAFQGLPAQQAECAEVTPYFASSVFSMPVPDAESLLSARRRFEDGNGRLPAFQKALAQKAGPLTAEEWFKSLQPREVARVTWRGEDGVERDALLLRSSKDLKLGNETPNAFRGSLGALLGPCFAVVDTVSASVNARWSVFGDIAAVRAFTDPSFLDYSLKDRLEDASLSLPQGFLAYASFTDAPERVTDCFESPLSEPLKAYVLGSGYAPAVVGMDFSGERPAFQLRVEKRVLKGTRVQVLERDTTVVVPTGLFPVQNFNTGQTNYLYQNDHLSICLNDENGKGVWGIPFKEPLCGRVQNIDYYNNGKIQFLFCASDKLYLLDRLGHWVAGFPVSLGKSVLLGPDAYDFTGAGGYTVMVLHKDNSLERYNLHGQKPEGWKGIHAPETVKNLPELVETRGKKYWAVRTSVRTLIYPFEGGECLTADEGGKMLKPDTELTPTSKGVSAVCYDGRTREIKLN